MRIAVCTSQIPFEWGGCEILTEALVRNLREWGHEVETVRIPLCWNQPDELLKSYLAWRLINVKVSEGVTIDRVIALKFPAYVVPHPYKVTWLVHQLRQAYDLLNTEYSYFGNSQADRDLLELIQRMDAKTIAESRHVFSISQNVADRLERYNRVPSEVLYPPPAHDGAFRNDGYGDYILSVSRLNVLKRVDLLVRAMGLVETPVRCRIVGQGDRMDSLRALAREAGAEARIDFLGFVPDEDVLGLYAAALALFYAPLDEDYGLATVEANKSGKAVLTASDSGGVLEFVRDGVTGYVVEADDPAALAQRIDALYLDRGLAERLGAAAQEIVGPITWETTIRRLTEV